MEPRLVHLAILALFLPDVLYAETWLVMDIAARLGVWPRDWVWVDIYAFIAVHPIWAEWIFFVAATLKLTAWIAIALRWKASLLILGLASFLGVTDWVLLSANGYYSGGVESFLQVIVELITLAGLYLLHRRGYLR